MVKEKLEPKQTKSMIKMAINLAAIFILYSCQPIAKNKIHSKEETVEIGAMDQTDISEIYEWKYDSLGCKNLRNPEMFYKLFVDNKMSIENSNKFLMLFGKPNKVEKFNDRLVYIYYYNSICYKNKLKINSDKSSVRVSFNLQGIYINKDTRVE